MLETRKTNTFTHQKQPGQTVILGMAGLGTVGTGVYKVLSQHPELYFKTITVRDISKARDLDGLDPDRLSVDPMVIAEDPDIQVVIEVIGGVDIAKDLVTKALTNGKHVITANKELIAKYGYQLFELARSRNVRLMFEGAVAGGIPIIMPLKLSLAANRILEIAGILNGTTNYILTKMSDEGRDYKDALREAQAKGFAEADPTSDVEGFDTSYKISILSSIAFKKRIEMSDVYCQGISEITAEDIKSAQSLGYAIKLIGLCRPVAPADNQTDDNPPIDVRVHPMLIPFEHPLASIKNEYNAIWIKGDAVGDVMFYGKGAGELPTASAVCGDVLALSNDILKGNDPFPAMALEISGDVRIQPITETRNKYYIRVQTVDMPGVIGNLGKACGEFGVSLSAVLQRTTHADGSASIILITHEVNEKQMRQALDRIRQQETTQEVSTVLRVL